MSNASDPIFPPLNWDWDQSTELRAAAIGFNGIVVVVLVICCAVPWCRGQCLAPIDWSTPRLILQAVVIGLVGSLWLHFWPCLFWTCDWGPGDGQGVRGAIWFIGWGVISAIWLCVGCARRQKREPDSAPRQRA